MVEALADTQNLAGNYPAEAIAVTLRSPTFAMSEYTGVDNLEAMTQYAHNYNRFLIRRVESNGSGHKELVDFGAGTGLFASAMQRAGFRVICVEPDVALQGVLCEQGLESYPSLEQLPGSASEFIYSLNVLEHIEDDSATIRAIYSRLSPGGALYLYVPAFDVLYSSMDRKVGHFRRYRKATLLPQLQRAGFIIRRARYVDSLGFAASLWYKFFGNDRGDLHPRALALYDRWVFPAARLLDFFVGFWFGKNLEVIAVRPS